GGNKVGAWLYYRVAGTEPATYSWSFSASNLASGGMIAYRGVLTGSPVDVSGGLGAAQGSGVPAIPANAGTTTTANDMVLAFFADAYQTTFTAPSGMTDAYDAATTGSKAGDGITLEAADVVQTSSGSTGTKTATLNPSGSDYTGQLVALKAAANTP